jgi:alpha-N-arabinofuranosidase
MPYTNPVLGGFYPDPTVCRVGEDYYLATSSFVWFPGMPVFHSRDLVHWRQIGHILDRDSQLPLRTPLQDHWQGLWAPTLRYHDGRFYCTNINQGGGGAFLVTADDPAGPWSEPIGLEGDGWDNSLLIEPDGSAWYHRAAGMRIVQYPLDLATGQRLGEDREIFAGTGAGGLEAPHLYHIGQWYYLLVAEGGTHWNHQVSIARSRSPHGPFEPSPHGPLLTHRHTEMSQIIKGLGHGDLIEAHDGSWWMVCLGMRTYGWICFGASHLGRETFLAPVSWGADGWPTVNGGRDLQVEMDVPTLPLHPFETPPTLTRFETPALGLEWNTFRNPLPGAARLDDPPGALTLRAGGTSLGDPDATMVARRQQHPRCTSRCCLLDTDAPAPEAGLTTFMDPGHHCELFVRPNAGGREVVVRRTVGTLQAEVAREEIGPGEVELFVVAEPRWYRFGYAIDGLRREDLAVAETRHLAVELAWGFSGVYVGLYAVDPAGSGEGAAGAARFAWFEHRPDPDASWTPTMSMD